VTWNKRQSAWLPSDTWGFVLEYGTGAAGNPLHVFMQSESLAK